MKEWKSSRRRLRCISFQFMEYDAPEKHYTYYGITERSLCVCASEMHRDMSYIGSRRICLCDVMWSHENW